MSPHKLLFFFFKSVPIPAVSISKPWLKDRWLLFESVVIDRSAQPPGKHTVNVMDLNISICHGITKGHIPNCGIFEYYNYNRFCYTKKGVLRRNNEGGMTKIQNCKLFFFLSDESIYISKF